MTATDISNYGAGIVALALIFWSYMSFVKSLKPLIEKQNEVVQNNTQALQAHKISSENISKALELLDISIRSQTDTYEHILKVHDERAADIQKDVKIIKEHVIRKE